MHVLIIGAGLGGLCLAHGLRQHDLEVTVLERQGSAGQQPASYGIHLNADGLAALHECLPADNWRRLDATTRPALDVVRFRNEQLRVLAQRDHDRAAVNLDPVTRRRAVRRDALRDALLHGLDESTVHWNKRFERYDTRPDGRVAVHCTDGTRYTADVVVGADGSNSRVRAQRLPQVCREELGILTVAGRAPVTPALRDAVPATLIDGSINNIVPSRPGWMFVSTWDTGTPGAPADTTGPAVTEFAVWAWAADRASYPGDVNTYSPDRLHALVTDRVARWTPAIRTLIDASDRASVATVALRSMPQLPEWQPSSVTLLGGAIHNMTPMAGIGANTALRDAGELSRALTGGDGDLVDRVGRYETRMRGYANEALALSRRNARSAASPARVPRAAFRTVLRVAEAVPAVKRAMFGSPAATRTATRTA